MSNTSTSVRLDKEQILYKRTRQGKYVPVSDPWAISGLREGHWYVCVRPGCTTIRTPTWPDHMEIEAALGDLEEKLIGLLREASQAKHRCEKLSPAEKRAWDNLIAVGGDQFSTLSYGSLQSIVDALLGKVKDRLVEKGVVPPPRQDKP